MDSTPGLDQEPKNDFMKKLFLFLLLGLFAAGGQSQNWAPVGARWYFTEYFFGSGDVDYLMLEALKDTVFEGKACRKITKRHNLVCADRPMVEYMYEENQRVYFYDTTFHEYQVLYDFTPEVGHSWFLKVMNYADPPDTDTLFVTVESIEPVVINGTMLNKFLVTYDFHNEMVPGYTYSGEIIERIGDLWYMFNYAPSFGFVCDGNLPGGLRCYEDAVIGHWETGIADSCDQMIVGIDQNPVIPESAISLFPNPVDDFLKIGLKMTGKVRFRINGIGGDQILQGFVGPAGIPVSSLRAGLYILYLEGQESLVRYTAKFIKI